MSSVAGCDVSEFDAFGPWVDEVTRVQDVPRLYRAHPIDFDRVLLVLKIPREIERRNANPAMHLYDALVILDEERLTVLSRRSEGDGYGSRSVRLDSLVAMIDSVHLLDGLLELHPEHGQPLVLRYNASSHDRIAALVRRMRDVILGRREPSAGDGEVVAPGRVLLPHAKRDYGLFGAWAALQGAIPGLQAAAAHPSAALRPRDGDLLAELLHRLRPTRLSAAIVGVSPYEVHLVHRRQWLARGPGEDLSMAHTVLLRAAGLRVDVAPHPHFDGVDAVRVSTGDAVVDLVLSTESDAGEVLRAALGD